MTSKDTTDFFVVGGGKKNTPKPSEKVQNKLGKQTNTNKNTKATKGGVACANGMCYLK